CSVKADSATGLRLSRRAGRRAPRREDAAREARAQGVAWDATGPVLRLCAAQAGNAHRSADYADASSRRVLRRPKPARLALPTVSRMSSRGMTISRGVSKLGADAATGTARWYMSDQGWKGACGPTPTKIRNGWRKMAAPTIHRPVTRAGPRMVGSSGGVPATAVGRRPGPRSDWTRRKTSRAP